jgi:hypothetical protein
VSLAIAVLVTLAVRQHLWVQRYAVGVLYWDGWDLYDPLFRGQGWWASFDQQHGPHRQGLGGWAIRIGAGLTNWDARANALVTSVALIVAATLGIALAWRCGLRGWLLAAVPVLYLNVRQTPTLVALANPSHGAFPLLLLTITGLALFDRRPWVRASLLAALTTLLVFTGFGLFAGLVVPTLLVHEVIRALRGGDHRRAAAAAAAVLCVGFAWGLFCVGYRFDPAVDNFRFPVEHPVQYLDFICVLAANYIGTAGPARDGELRALTMATGLAVAAIGMAVGVARGRRVWRSRVFDDPASAVICLLAAYDVLFAIDAAIGRTPAGWAVAVAARYVTLCVPMGLAILLHLGLSRRRAAKRLGLAFAAWMAVGTTFLQPADVADCVSLHNACVRWTHAFATLHDPRAADRLAGFQVYPLPLSEQRLSYLRRHRLNVFDPSQVTAAVPLRD